jgi:hypothetical protein
MYAANTVLATGFVSVGFGAHVGGLSGRHERQGGNSVVGATIQGKTCC